MGMTVTVNKGTDTTVAATARVSGNPTAFHPLHATYAAAPIIMALVRSEACMGAKDVQSFVFSAKHPNVARDAKAARDPMHTNTTAALPTDTRWPASTANVATLPVATHAGATTLSVAAPVGRYAAAKYTTVVATNTATGSSISVCGRYYLRFLLRNIFPFQPRAEMQLQLRKFDPSRVKDAAVCMLIGKRNTGKSVLVKDIMYFKRHIPWGIVFSPTESAQGFFKDWIPDSFIYERFDATVLEQVIRTQKQRIKEGTATPVFIILDDCMFDKSFLKSEVMRSLFFNGRHWKILLIITAQFCGDIDPASRCNIDYCFVLRDPIIQNRERLYKNFFGLLPKLSDFCKLMDATTENYECLCLDNTSQSNKLEDSLYYYKAKPEHNFKMGSAAFWRFHKEAYDPGYDERKTEAARIDSARKGIRVTKLK